MRHSAHFSSTASRIFHLSNKFLGQTFMDFFFNPRGIAVIGASANPVKGGYFILKNLIKGFNGGIYPVNPAYPEIDGLPCYPSVLDVPDPVDLAIIFVPAPRVPGVLRECAQRGINGAMIESGGFAESSEAGRQLQNRLVEIHRETGIRIWGPNCMGLVDAVHDFVFSFVLPAIWEKGRDSGNVSLVVQSGMLSAGFLIDIMSNGIMGISKACSIGNKADVNECDILEYLIADPDTGAIGLYLESIPDGQRFMDLCRKSPKPIVVLRGGKSRKGAEAAKSHTASLAGNGAVIGGALAQVGVIEACDFKQMMDLCRSLADYPQILPKDSRRVAVLTMSGAAGIVSADFIEQHGLAVAELSGSTVDALNQIFPPWMPASNPVDLWPAVELHGRKKANNAAFQAVFADPDVDAVLFHSFVGGPSSRIDMSALVEMAGHSGKPLFGWLMGKRSETHQFQRNARELNLPVVLKGVVPGEVHKTELGLVRTGISSVGEVERAFSDLRHQMPEDGSVLIQKQIQGAPELIAGLIRDPQFGPCVMCGFGGILAEVMADSVFAAAPLSRPEALALIDRLKTRKLLNGFRGFAAVDRGALADILVRLGELGAAFERIKEIDINPLIVREGIPVAVDATIIAEISEN
jgi:acyl-CoA synthetase (NDP forming)